MFRTFSQQALVQDSYSNDNQVIPGIRQELDILHASELPHLVNMVGNRAYILHGKPYADLIHFKNIHEHAHNFILRKIKEKRRENAGKTYVGVGGAINFSYIAAAKPANAILCDINPLQKILWDEVIDLLAHSPTPNSFLQGIAGIEHRIYDRIKSIYETIDFSNINSITYEFDKCGHLGLTGIKDRAPIFRFKGGIKEWLQDRESDDHNWLDDEYEYLHQMAYTNSIGAVTLDLLDEESCFEMAEFLRQTSRHPEIGMIYISSIADFLSIGKEWTGRDNPDFKKKIIQNLDILNPAKTATIVDSRQYWPQERKMDITINNGFFPSL